MNSTLWKILISGMSISSWVQMRDLGIRGSVPDAEHTNEAVPGLLDAIEADQTGEAVALLTVYHQDLATAVANLMGFEPALEEKLAA